MRQAVMSAWLFAECRMGQIPSLLGRDINYLNHAPQLAAGYLTAAYEQIRNNLIRFIKKARS